ncbi:MAG: CBS domain-containing protein [Desulfurococcales archaeon]|nr:CBS domain-containing protein [Desulfurococcales archaeon]
MRLREDLSGTLEAFDVIRHDLSIVKPDEDVGNLVSIIIDSPYEIIAVVDGGKFIGVVTTKNILRALTSKSGGLKARDLVAGDYPILSVNWSLSKALGVMLLGGVCCAPVVYEDGSLAGVVTLSSLSKVMIEDIDVEELHAAD